MRIRPMTLLFLALCLPLFGEVEFGGLDLTANNQLLFRARVNLPDFGSYDTLFLADAETRKLEQLTFFPERMLLLRDRGQLQIQNRFGVFRTDEAMANLAPVDLFPSFVRGNEIQSGKILPIETSPDGRFLVFMRPTSVAYGDLILYDTDRSGETVMARHVQLTLNQPMTLWSADSNWFVYDVGGSLYYYSINQHDGNRVVDESYRRISDGTVGSARWGRQNTLYYVSGAVVYRIKSGEFFTKSLYSDVLRMGQIAGKIPFSFDPNFDSFWISPDGTKILLNKQGRNLMLYFLALEDFSSASRIRSLPYLYLPRNTNVRQVIWSSTDVVTLLAESPIKNRDRYLVFRLEIPEDEDVTAFDQTSDEGVTDIVLSPDGSRAALITSDRIVLKDYLSWAGVGEIITTDPISAVWLNNDELVVGGYDAVRRFSVDSGQAGLITLSQPGSYGFDPAQDSVMAEVNGNNFSRDLGSTANWQEGAGGEHREPAVASTDYRVYLEVSSRGSYRNMVMVRDIREFGTVTLFNPEEFAYESFPAIEEPVDPESFSHGSRIRQRQVALVFDAVDSIEGLPTILETLKEYGIRATFFVGGEAIRRYPAAMTEIAESGHEVGSLFYVNFDMTDERYNLDGDFIKLGLARTEDIYYEATGREISLLWHAPYYFVNTDIIAASREMNYTYVGRDVDSLDWVTRENQVSSATLYMSAANLVERVIEKKKPGSIIPVLTGVTDGYRGDHLFQRLDLLINGLIKEGYQIVPVSALIETAR